MNNYCSEEEGCVFHLTDDDMGDLAAALPRLKCLQLGRPYRFNSCKRSHHFPLFDIYSSSGPYSPGGALQYSDNC